MARQLPELDELLGNYLADDDLILVRDMSAKQDKRATIGALLSYVIQNIPDKAITSDMLSDGSVTTRSLADNSVTTRTLSESSVVVKKIDFDSFDDEFPTLNGDTNNVNVNSQAWYNQYTYKIPKKGVYCFQFAQEMTSGSNSNDFYVRIARNRNTLKDGSSGGSSWVNYVQATAFAIAKCNVGDIIEMQSKGGGTGAYGTRHGKYTIARIR